MSRRKKLIWLLGVGACLGVAYTGFPLVVAGLVQHALTTQGLTDINIKIGYPGWRGVRIHALRFSGRAGSREYRCQFKDIDIVYGMNSLAAGKVAQIRVPAAVVRFYPVAGSKPSSTDSDPPPVTALLPAHWLARLPIQELLVEQISIAWEESAGSTHKMRLSGGIHNGEAHAHAEIKLATTPARQFQVTLQAKTTGEAQLLLSTIAPSSLPVFELGLKAVATAQGQVEINGRSQVRLDTLATLVEPWLPVTDLAPGLTGDLQSDWRMTLPMASTRLSAQLLSTARVHTENVLDARMVRAGPLAHPGNIYLNLTAGLEKGAMYWRVAEQSRFSSSLDRSSAGQLKQSQAFVLRLTRALAGQLQMRDDALELSLQQGARFSVTPLMLGELSLPEMQLELSAPAALRYWWSVRRWQAQPMTLALAASPIEWQKNRVAHRGVVLKLTELHGQGKAWRVIGEVLLPGISAQLRQQVLAQSELRVTFQADQQQLTTQAVLQSAKHAVVLEGRGLHHFADGNGQLTFTLGPVTFSNTGFVLSSLLEPWPYVIELDAGQVSASGHMAWRRSAPSSASGKFLFKQQLSLLLRNLGGHYNKIHFAGLSADVALANDRSFHTTKAAQLTLKSLDVGLPIENLQLDFAIKPSALREPLLAVNKFSAEVLGGRVHADPFLLDLARDSNRFVLQIEQLKLEELIKLEQQEGLQGTGLLDGQLPLVISPRGIEVQRGKLAVRAPGGRIHYSPDGKLAALAQSNKNVKLIAEALSDFHYHTLDVISDYSPEGKLALQVKLQGMNPGWQSGRAVHLNINLEENIPALLRSLQMADKLSNEITERVRKGFEDSQ